MEDVSAVGGVAVEGYVVFQDLFQGRQLGWGSRRLECTGFWRGDSGIAIGFAEDGEFASVDFAGGGLVEPGHAGEGVIAGG